MHPVIALYLAIKRKKSGRFQFIPVGRDDFGVVKVALVEGNIVGFDSTWGAYLESLKHMLTWKKAIVRHNEIGSSDTLVRVYIPRQEALSHIVNLELKHLPDVRDISYEEARDLLKLRIGKRKPLSPDEVRQIKQGKTEGKSFFLQRDPDHASIFITGKEVYTFRIDGDSVNRISISDFPEEGAFMVNSDHLVVLTVAVPFFVPGREISGEEALREVERLKKETDKIWHIILSGIGDIYVSVVGYRGTVMGVFILHGEDLKARDEKALKTIVKTINLKGRLYEHGTDMRST